jgi:K+-transporting ATPase ATPase A chain
MNGYEWAEILFLAALVLALTPIFGSYMARVYTKKNLVTQSALGWLEKFCYFAAGADDKKEMTWTFYAKTLLVFNVIGFVFLFGFHLLQGLLPLNPQKFSGTSFHLAFNNAISFVTNTNWQSYSGETTLSYLTQMLGLTVQNFLSAATGMCVLLPLTRGLTRKEMQTIGNFWFDLVRTIVYILLPLSFVLAMILVGQGAIQTFSPYVEVTTLENAKQVIPLGPVASQVAIKQIGTNGGGYFSANGAHPFENPTGLTSFFEILAIFLIPAASLYMYGILVGSKKNAWLLFILMSVLFFIGLGMALCSQHMRNPVLEAYPVVEGQETRFGASNSLLWTVATTASANGSVNAMISSLPPLAGGVAIFNLISGELIFGGVGVGLCSMLMFVLLTVFLCGLMVGRTPEYLGKKIESREMQWVILAILIPPSLILIGAGMTCLFPLAESSLTNQGPHGLSEILYAFASCAANNGSSFAGLNANTPYYNIILGVVMATSRLVIILASLGLAGLLVKKKTAPYSIGTFSTNTLLFFILLMSVILIVGAITFFPALSLGPLVEHLLMVESRSF